MYNIYIYQSCKYIHGYIKSIPRLPLEVGVWGWTPSQVRPERQVGAGSLHHRDQPQIAHSLPHLLRSTRAGSPRQEVAVDLGHLWGNRRGVWM